MKMKICVVVFLFSFFLIFSIEKTVVDAPSVIPQLPSVTIDDFFGNVTYYRAGPVSGEIKVEFVNPLNNTFAIKLGNFSVLKKYGEIRDTNVFLVTQNYTKENYTEQECNGTITLKNNTIVPNCYDVVRTIEVPFEDFIPVEKVGVVVMPPKNKLLLLFVGKWKGELGTLSREFDPQLDLFGINYSTAKFGAWFNTSYAYKTNITITAGSGGITVNSPINISLDTTNRAKFIHSWGNDTSIVINDLDEVDRWNSTPFHESSILTTIWWKATSGITQGSVNNSYVLYHGWAGAGIVKDNARSIFPLFLDSDTTFATIQGGCSQTKVGSGWGSYRNMTGYYTSDDGMCGLTGLKLPDTGIFWFQQRWMHTNPATLKVFQGGLIIDDNSNYATEWSYNFTGNNSVSRSVNSVRLATGITMVGDTWEYETMRYQGGSADKISNTFKYSNGTVNDIANATSSTTIFTGVGRMRWEAFMSGTKTNSRVESHLMYGFYSNWTSYTFTLVEEPQTSPFLTYSLNSTNSTKAGEGVLFSLNWTSSASLDKYMFSYCNGSYNHPLTTIYNYSALYNSTNASLVSFYWASPADSTLWGGTNMTAPNYTNAQSIDGNYLNACSDLGNDDPFININFTIQEPVANIQWINVTLMGYEAQTEDAQCTIWNYTTGAFQTFAQLPEPSLGTISINYTTGLSSIISTSNKQLVIHCEGTAFDDKECMLFDYIVAKVGYNTSVVSSYAANCSDSDAILTNDTWTAFGANTWSNISKIVNSTSGATIKWCFYANTTTGLINGTSCVTPFMFFTTAGVQSRLIDVCDSFSTSDLGTKKSYSYKTSSDSGAMNDGTGKGWTSVKFLGESEPMSEFIGRLYSGFRKTYDSEPLLDLGRRLVLGSRSLSDFETLADTFYKFSIKIKSLFESYTLADMQSKSYGGKRSPSDSESGSDTLGRLYNGTRNIRDSSGFSDFTGRQGFYKRLLSETASMVDSIFNFLLMPRTLSDSEGMSDLLSRSYFAKRVVSDYDTFIDTLTRNVSFGRIISDIFSFVDNVLRKAMFWRTQHSVFTDSDNIDSSYNKYLFEYSQNETNSTLFGSAIMHSLLWKSNIGLSGYIFSFCNGTWNGTDCGIGGESATISVGNITNTTFKGIQDTDVWESQPTFNAGNFPYIGTSSVVGNMFRTYVKLNLSSLNLNSPTDIINATYCNYVYAVDSAQTVNITPLFVNNTIWIEGTGNNTNDCIYDDCKGGIVWNGTGVTYGTEQPCGNVAGTPNSTCVFMDNFTQSKSVNVWVCFNVTTAAKNYNATDKMFSIMLSSETNNSIATTRKSFMAREASSFTPYLTIFYNVNVTNEGWVNDTWTSMTGTENWSNVTKGVNGTSGAMMAWCVYANDTTNNWNVSTCINPFTYATSSGTESFFRSLFDNIASEDSLLRKIIGFRSVADYGNLVDSFFKIFSGNRQFSDMGALSDYLARLISFKRTTSDYETIVDNAGRLHTGYRIISSLVSDVDTPYKKYAGWKSAYDMDTIIDSSGHIFKGVKVLSDYETIIDTKGRLYSGFRVSSDFLSEVDNAYRNFFGSRSNYEYMTIVDTKGKVYTGMKVYGDYITIIDTQGKLYSGKRIVSDTVTEIDNAYMNFVSWRSNYEQATIMDSQGRIHSGLKVSSDDISLSDMMFEYGIFYENAHDSTSLNDIVTRLFFGSRYVFDNVLFVDNEFDSGWRKYSLSDSLILSGIVDRLGDFNRVVDDSTNLLDTLYHQLANLRIASDSLILSELTERWDGYNRDINNIIGEGDFVGRIASYSRTTVDFFTLSDLFNNYKLLTKALFDSFDLSDTLVKTKIMYRSVSDFFNFGDGWFGTYLCQIGVTCPSTISVTSGGGGSGLNVMWIEGVNYGVDCAGIISYGQPLVCVVEINNTYIYERTVNYTYYIPGEDISATKMLELSPISTTKFIETIPITTFEKLKWSDLNIFNRIMNITTKREITFSFSDGWVGKNVQKTFYLGSMIGDNLLWVILLILIVASITVMVTLYVAKRILGYRKRKSTAKVST